LPRWVHGVQKAEVLPCGQVTVGCQHPAVGVEGAVEEHPLDPLVVVEVLDVPQVGHRDTNPRVQDGPTGHGPRPELASATSSAASAW
jgi:hypothetical protein